MLAVPRQHREHPQAVQHRLRALAHQNFLAGKNQQHVPIERLRRILLRQHGQILRVARVVRVAVRPERANVAVWRAGDTDCRPQVHQRLIEIARTRRRHKRIHLFLQFAPNGRNAHVLADAHHPAGDADDVAVHRRNTLVKRDACNRPGSVCPDALQLPQLRHLARHFAPEVAHHLPRRLMQIPRARIVPQPLPELEHVRLVRRRQRRHIREARQKALVVPAHRLHARLLQHRLAHPCAVRVVDAAPRQRPRVLVVPSQQQCRNRLTHSIKSPSLSSYCTTEGDFCPPHG